MLVSLYQALYVKPLSDAKFVLRTASPFLMAVFSVSDPHRAWELFSVSGFVLFSEFSLSFAFLRYVGFSLKTVNAAEG